MRSLLLAAAALTLPATAQAAAFMNGSFESGTITDPFVQLNTGSTAIDGWTVGGDSIDYIGNYWQPAAGSRSLDLSGSNAGSISQTFDTAIGQAYLVSFAFAGNPVAGPMGKDMTVQATGNIKNFYNFQNSEATALDNMRWERQIYSFVAKGTSTTLTFASLTSGGYGPALDDVAVSGVPEPATWAMMIGGMGFVGGALRRRSRTAPAIA